MGWPIFPREIMGWPIISPRKTDWRKFRPVTLALWVCPVNETVICPCPVIGTLQYWSESEKTVFKKVRKIFRQTNKS